MPLDWEAVGHAIGSFGCILLRKGIGFSAGKAKDKQVPGSYQRADKQANSGGDFRELSRSAFGNAPHPLGRRREKFGKPAEPLLNRGKKQALLRRQPEPGDSFVFPWS